MAETAAMRRFLQVCPRSIGPPITFSNAPIAFIDRGRPVEGELVLW